MDGGIGGREGEAESAEGERERRALAVRVVSAG